MPNDAITAAVVTNESAAPVAPVIPIVLPSQTSLPAGTESAPKLGSDPVEKKADAPVVEAAKDKAPTEGKPSDDKKPDVAP